MLNEKQYQHIVENIDIEAKEALRAKRVGYKGKC